MTTEALPFPKPRTSLVSLAVVIAAAFLAVVSARPYAGGWNDGSRLATVECLVEYHTLAIDRSVFVRVGPCDDLSSCPYPRDEPGLLQAGTGDKLFIHGHYYSDKSPVPALLLAGVYRAWQGLTGLSARTRPDLFAYVMTLASSGLAYVVAVWCVFALGGVLRLPLVLRLLLTASFALATVSLTYARHVNNHILLLGVASGVTLLLARLPNERPGSAWRWVLLLGTLAGLGYTIDLGTGPVLLTCTLALVAWRCRRVLPLAAFVAAALPWLVLHHVVNYTVGGTFGPANAVPDYFQWPGSPFNAQNMTGGWKHPDVVHFLTYAASLLFGKRGFAGHNLPLFLVLPAVGVLLWRRGRELPELFFAVGWCGGTWLAYAVNSNNSSGLCCSIRWFVPLLAPCYYVLALALRDLPATRGALALLSGWGALLAMGMWSEGPWIKHMVPYLWPLQAAALLSGGLYAAWSWRRSVRRAPRTIGARARAA
jgi:hypothetical protein